MGLSTQEVESMLNLGGNTLEQAYKVLEIEPTATDDEIKQAYRKLALKHHPDRVATLGEDVKKAVMMMKVMSLIGGKRMKMRSANIAAR